MKSSLLVSTWIELIEVAVAKSSHDNSGRNVCEIFLAHFDMDLLDISLGEQVIEPPGFCNKIHRRILNSIIRSIIAS